MKKISQILIAAANIVLIAVVVWGYFARRSHGNGPCADIKPQIDTMYVFDTIRIKTPVKIESRIIDTLLVHVRDTVTLRDTIFLRLPREQVRWEDSLSVVYASGYRASVDSVIHYTKATVVTKVAPLIQTQRTHWGLGLSAGVGLSSQGLTPYVGLGVSYNILSW